MGGWEALGERRRNDNEASTSRNCKNATMNVTLASTMGNRFRSSFVLLSYFSQKKKINSIME